MLLHGILLTHRIKGLVGSWVLVLSPWLVWYCSFCEASKQIAREFWLAAVALATVKWQQRCRQLIRALHKNGLYSIWNSPILKMR